MFSEEQKRRLSILVATNVHVLYKCKGHFNSARVCSVESVQRVSIIAHIIYYNGCAFISVIIIFVILNPLLLWLRLRFDNISLLFRDA